jgi:PIN domain nuclease of toxin-antitoxin system
VIVLDTHSWLWWVSAPRKLSRRARGAIERADSIGVSAASCYEVAALAARGRITLDRAIADWVRGALAAERIEPLPIDPVVALEAALLGQRFPADPFDRMIYSTARVAGKLVTRDERLRRFDPSLTIW